MVWNKNDSAKGKPVLALVGQYHKDLGHPSMRLPATFLARSSLYSLTQAIDKWNKDYAAAKARADKAAAAAAKKAAKGTKTPKTPKHPKVPKPAGGKGKVTPKKSTTPKTDKASASILDQIKKALAPPKPAKTKTAKPTHANTSPDPFLSPDEIALLKADERNPARRPLHKTIHHKQSGGRVVDQSLVPSTTGPTKPATTKHPKAPSRTPAGSTSHPYQPPQITAPTIVQGSAHSHQPQGLAGASVPPHRTTSPSTNYAHQGGFLTGQHSYYNPINIQHQGGFLRARATRYQPNNYSTAIG